jgi:hypothetical protein
MEIISRKEARAAALSRYYTAKPCRNHGHLSPRWTSNAVCVECDKLYNQSETRRTQRNVCRTARRAKAIAGSQDQQVSKTDWLDGVPDREEWERLGELIPENK